MSIFDKPGSGGGISPEQLDQLVSDGELSSSQAGQDLLLSFLLFGGAVDWTNQATYTPVSAQISGVDTKVNEVMGAVGGVQSAVAPSGTTILITNSNGTVPAGYSRASGQLVPQGLYGQGKFQLANYGTSVSAVSLNKVWRISATAGSSQVWDIGTSANTTLSNWPGSASYPPGAVVATDEALWQFGCSGSNGGTTSSYRYTLSSNTWTAIALLPASRNFALAAELADGRMLVIGGSTGTSLGQPASFVNTVYRYDPTTNAYTTVAALPFRAANGYATRLLDGRIFCVWSNTSDGTTATGNKAAIYSPTADTWTEVDTPSLAGVCYTTADGKVMVVGASLTNSIMFDESLPAGSRWVSASITAPTGFSSSVSLFSLNAGFGKLLSNAFLPLLQNNTVAALYWTGATPANNAQSLYAVKD